MKQNKKMSAENLLIFKEKFAKIFEREALFGLNLTKVEAWQYSKIIYHVRW